MKVTGLATDLRPALLVILGVKASIFWVSALPLLLDRRPIALSELPQQVSTSWYRWDGLSYRDIAMNGYVSLPPDDKLIVFYPLFPFLIRVLAAVVGNFSSSGLIISNAASVAGLLLFFRLAEREVGREAAWGGLLAYLCFPTSYFFNAPYTEGLFLLLSVAGWRAARNGQWRSAGVWGGLAALTRVTGVLLFPAFAVEFFLQRREEKKPWTPLLWLLLIPAFFALYLLINQRTLGSPFAFSQMMENHWYKELAGPWNGLWNTLKSAATFRYNHYALMMGLAEFVSALALIGGAVWSFTRLRLSYAVYMALLTLLCLSTSFLLSTPRYLLGAFPLFFILGQGAKYKVGFGLALFFSAQLLTLFTLRFVKGYWAF